MRSRHTRSFAAVCSLAILFCASVFASQKDDKNSTVPVTVTVTVLGVNNTPAPEIPQQDVTVHSGKSVLKVTDWEHAQGEKGPLELALLLDENARTGLVAQQLGDIANFIQAQAPSTEVGLFYAEAGSAYAAAPFTTDHQKVAQALHLTLGRAGASPSIYLSLADLAKHWPLKPASRREVVVLGSGNDPLSPGADDPYADESIEAVVNSGLTVHAIPLAGTRYSRSFRGTISAGKLIQLSDATGGRTVEDQVGAPVSLAPYFAQLNQILSHQYLLTFLIKPSDKKKGELRGIQVQLEEHNVKVFAPKQVVVPGS